MFIGAFVFPPEGFFPSSSGAFLAGFLRFPLDFFVSAKGMHLCACCAGSWIWGLHTFCPLSCLVFPPCFVVLGGQRFFLSFFLFLMRGSFCFSDLVLVFLLRLDGLRSILVFFLLLLKGVFFSNGSIVLPKRTF